MRKLTTLAMGLLGTMTLGALANEPYFPRSEKGLQKLDINKDGKLTALELAPALMKRLTRMDSNNDKSLSAEEIDASMLERVQKRRGRIMLLMDADRDGKITQAEVDVVLNDMFDKADTNSDGGVDMAEIKTFKRGIWRKALIDGKTVK
jgi:Ca2+-binding EF-hand superfamily protein